MTGNRAKTRIDEEKSLVRVCRESAKILDFRWIGMPWGFLTGVLALLTARRVEIEAPIVVLLTVWRAGVRL